jgi:hypothetical protein
MALPLLACSSAGSPSLTSESGREKARASASDRTATWCAAVEDSLAAGSAEFRCLPIPNFLVTGFYGTAQNPERSDFVNGCFAGQQDAAARLRMTVRPAGNLAFSHTSEVTVGAGGEVDLGFLGPWAPRLRAEHATMRRLRIRVELGDAEIRVLSSVAEILAQHYEDEELPAPARSALDGCLNAICGSGEALVYTAKVLAAIPVITVMSDVSERSSGGVSLVGGLADFELRAQGASSQVTELRAKNKLNVAALLEPARPAFERSLACNKARARRLRAEVHTALRELGLRTLAGRDLDHIAAETAKLRGSVRNDGGAFSEIEKAELLRLLEAMEAAAEQLAAARPSRRACDARGLLAGTLTHGRTEGRLRELAADVAEPLHQRLTELANTGGLPCADPAWYRDQDGDGYGDADGVTRAARAPQGHVANSLDCYDRSRQAHPGQTAYFATHRGDGSFDYDCDGKEARQRELLAGGCQSITRFGYPIKCWAEVGWQGRVPGCGHEAQWLVSCATAMLSCDDAHQELRTQGCR